MKAILRSGFLALAIVLPQVVPANANPTNWHQKCKTNLKEASKYVDKKSNGKFVFSRNDRRKAKLYYNEAIEAHNKGQWKLCAMTAFLIPVNWAVALRGGKPAW